VPKSIYIYGVFLVLWALLIVVEPWLGLKPNQIYLEDILTPPQWDLNDFHLLMGTDDLGRRIIDRLISGASVSFLVALGVALISLLIGTFIGVISAYAGGLWDHILVRVIDVFMAFPGILLAIALAGLMGPGINNLIIALSIVGWVGYARLARAQVMSIKQQEHVQAAIALGVSHRGIIRWHILPLISAPLIVEFTFSIAGLIIAEAGLSFLGLGIQAPDSSWGSMIKEGSQYLLIAPHLVIVPGVALMLTVLSVNQIGDILRDHFDPRMNKRSPV